MDTGGCETLSGFGGWFKYSLQSFVAVVYNITMTNNNHLDSHHVKMVTVYASSSAALKPVYYDAARRLGEVLAAAKSLSSTVPGAVV